ncbi:hypothetical protein PIB30_094803 [Stylosanthes scabra]|uniref:DUF4283 domain-containing protein n=1 Tax=Stylosanthes scabra TaxID=79078 RepID=A0ABU6ZU66_9FABA|nr:hypothetical protein [Stylosanthes scabra]
MPEFFKDVRPYWCFKWSLSRRVWLELMGLPIHVWSEDTFNWIVRGLVGKLVMQHDLTEGSASFSVARILIDCYQWEPILEWIVVKSEEVEFEVYVKEYGEEVMSKQTHLDGISKSSGCCSTCRTPEAREEAVEVSTEVEETSMLGVGHNEKVGADSVIENVINANLCSVQRCMRESGDEANRVEEHTDQVECMGLRKLFVEREVGKISNLSDSCPFSPGCGPCTDTTHVHNEMQLGELAPEDGLDITDRSVVAGDPNKDNEDKIEVEQRKLICEKGGIFLHYESDDMLLKNLVDKIKEPKSGDDPKARKSRGRPRQKKRVVLGPSKRLFLSEGAITRARAKKLKESFRNLATLIHEEMY